VREELEALSLLPYCRSALERRMKRITTEAQRHREEKQEKK